MSRSDLFFYKTLFLLGAGLHTFGPLFFLTQTTQNPYSIQILIVQCGVLALWALFGFFLWNRHSTLHLPNSTVNIPLLTFALWALMSWGLSFFQHGLFFRSGIFHEGLRGFIFLWVNGIGVFFLSSMVPPGSQTARTLRRLMLFVASLSAVYGVSQYLGFDPLWGAEINPFAGRPVSTYGNPNFLSTALVLLLPLLLYEYYSAPTRIKTWGWGSLGLIYTAALTATMTRSSWLGAVMGMALYLYLDRNTVRRFWVRTVVWGGGAGMITLFWPASSLGSPRPLSRLGELWTGISGAQIYGSWHQRLLIWRSAWDMWTERPIVGKGWGLFELFFPYYQGRLFTIKPFDLFRTHANNAHQLFLEIGSLTGLIGFGLFLWILLVTILTHRHFKKREGPPAKHSLAAALLAGMGGVLIDNALGNVSLFFAIPAFLFFWVWGQWAGLVGEKTIIVPRSLVHRRFMSFAFLTLSVLGIVFLSKGFVAEKTFFKGLRSQQTQSPNGSENLFLRSHKTLPYSVHTTFELGNIYLQKMVEAENRGFRGEIKENAERAVSFYGKGLQSNPSYDEIFFSRSKALRYLGRYGEAELDLRMALLINPLRKETYLALDELLTKKGNTKKERIALWTQAVAHFPDDFNARFQWALTLEEGGQMSEAHNAYEWCLARDLDHEKVWAKLKESGLPVSPQLLKGRELLFLIRSEARENRWERAHSHAEELIALIPTYTLALLIAADTAAQAENDSTAIQRYQEFLKRSPQHPEALSNLKKVMDRSPVDSPAALQ